MQPALSTQVAISHFLDSRGVRNVLKQIARKREQLQLVLPDGEAAQVRVVPDRIDVDRFEMLTVLVPGPSLRALHRGAQVTIRGALNGAALELEADLDAVDVQAQDGHLVCRMPQSGSLNERREWPRFPAPAEGARTVAVIHVPGEIMLCQVVNISRTGVRLRLDAPEVDVGDEPVLYCEIRRGDHLLQSKVEVRWKAMFDGEHQELGARFLARDGSFYNRADRLVAELERDWLRQYP